MNNYYKILDTEDTQDYCKDLIGKNFKCIEKSINHLTNTIFYHLETFDDILLFKKEELKRI